MKFNKYIILSTLIALVFFAAKQLNLFSPILSIFSKEASIYRNTVDGLIVSFYIAPLFGIIAILISVFIEKQFKLKAALIALSSYVIILGCGFYLERWFYRRQFLQQLRAEQQAALENPTQESQDTLSLLDPARPLTILNRLEPEELELAAHQELLIQVAARPEIISQGQTLRAELKVTLPGGIERKVIAETILRKTNRLAPDQRELLEGSLSYSSTYGAKFAYLTVYGERQISDSMSVVLTETTKH